MPKIFPYNLFTMKKLIKREVFHKRILDMTTQQDELLSVIQDGIDQSYDAQRLEFERKRAEWEKQQAEGGGSAATNLLRRTPEPTPGTPGFGGSPAITTPLIAVAECTEGSPAPGKDDDDEKGREFASSPSSLSLRLKCILPQRPNRSGASASMNRCAKRCTRSPSSRIRSRSS